ncbi:MAG: hypothetical protein ACE5DI_04025 [Candidatus Micrarchaeia archaeon]
MKVGQCLKQRQRKKRLYRECKETREAIRKNHKSTITRMDEAANKRCVKCNKLLGYRTKRRLCKFHWAQALGKRSLK